MCSGGLLPVEVGQDHGHRCVQVVFFLWRWARIMGMVCAGGLLPVEVGQDHGHRCVQVVFVLWKWARIMGTGVYRWS